MISSLNCSTFQNFTLQKPNSNEEKKSNLNKLGVLWSQNITLPYLGVIVFQDL